MAARSGPRRWAVTVYPQNYPTEGPAWRGPEVTRLRNHYNRYRDGLRNPCEIRIGQIGPGLAIRPPARWKESPTQVTLLPRLFRATILADLGGRQGASNRFHPAATVL